MQERLYITVPTEPDGAVCVHLAAWLAEVRADNPDLAITIEIVQHKPIAPTRNMQVRRFLAGAWDWFLTIDDDAVPDRETFRFLVDDLRRPEVDIVAGWSLRMSDSGPRPVLQRYTPSGGAIPYVELFQRPQGLHEIPDAGTGAHVLAAKRSALQKMLDAKVVWFKDEIADGSMNRNDIVKLVTAYRDNPAGVYAELERYVSDHDALNLTAEKMGERMCGQDVWFFRQAQRLGIRTFLDTRVFWGHVKPQDLRGEFLEVGRLRLELFQARESIHAEQNGQAAQGHVRRSQGQEHVGDSAVRGQGVLPSGQGAQNQQEEVNRPPCVPGHKGGPNGTHPLAGVLHGAALDCPGDCRGDGVAAPGRGEAVAVGAEAHRSDDPGLAREVSPC